MVQATDSWIPHRQNSGSYERLKLIIPNILPSSITKVQPMNQSYIMYTLHIDSLRREKLLHFISLMV